ncbi:hypothetical protein BC936DRAFT_137284 [Jimgerdemannia flammicorona]|uniref:Uncharacterized protein n=1 Tax=Jimgerdemannia flammicorona TaxID=994334 RepID=A0A433CXS2_9FUNG|nr:hypothetical protein BC936DRAFT_137284 [Jimgerdemannia flammicorona]
MSATSPCDTASGSTRSSRMRPGLLTKASSISTRWGVVWLILLSCRWKFSHDGGRTACHVPPHMLTHPPSPQVDYVAHDDIPYASTESNDVYAFVKAQGRFLPTRRTDGVSTSDLITRIVRDYDAYLRRNLERGVSAKELNISFLKEQEIKVQKSVSELRDSIKQTWEFWEGRNQELVRGFAGLFGVESVVDKFLFRRRYHKGVGGYDSRTPSELSNDETDARSDGDAVSPIASP